MSLSYGWEKLHLAVHALCSEGDTKDRLTGAVVNNLIHINPHNDLPEQMRLEFCEFVESMRRVNPISNEGAIRATVDSFQYADVKRAIEKIIGFYDQVCRYMGQR